MRLNTRVAVALAVVLVSAPLWLPFVPFAWWWLARERRRGRERGLRCLPGFVADSIAAHAEATLAQPPAAGWAGVARNVDAYLAAVRSPRHWRTLLMLVLVEFAPCLCGRRRLSRLPVGARREWIARRLSSTRGWLAAPALVRQLVRMGYYADPSVARSLGFRPMRERVRGLPSRERTAAFAAAARRRFAG